MRLRRWHGPLLLREFFRESHVDADVNQVCAGGGWRQPAEKVVGFAGPKPNQANQRGHGEPWLSEGGNQGMTTAIGGRVRRGSQQTDQGAQSPQTEILAGGDQTCSTLVLHQNAERIDGVDAFDSRRKVAEFAQGAQSCSVIPSIRNLGALGGPIQVAEPHDSDYMVGP